MININTIISQSKGIVSSEMDGETVMMSVEQGKYYCLDEIGSKIWEIIAKPQSVSALVDQLVEEYEVSKDECTNDVTELLQTLHQDGLICIDES